MSDHIKLKAKKRGFLLRPRFDVVSIGSVTRDVYIQSKGVKFIRNPKIFRAGVGECFALGSKINVEKIFFTSGGSAMNTAVSFSRLGLRSAAVARLGSDARGGEILHILQEEGVYTGCLQFDKKDTTAYSIIILASTGERTIFTYRGAAERIDLKDIHFKDLKAKWFYIGHLAGKSQSLFRPLIDFADEKGIKVAINPGSTQLTMSEAWWRNVLNKVDILILNREEASVMTHVPFGDEKGIFEKLDKWVRGVVVMTEGEKGVWVSDGRMRWHAGVLKEKRVADRTGAGDAFAAGFVAGCIKRGIRCENNVCYFEKKDMEYILLLASANATSQIEKIGAREGLLRKNESIRAWGKLSLGGTPIR